MSFATFNSCFSQTTIYVAYVIIRFFNRKITEFCMKNRRLLRNTRSTWNLSFREDLCDANLTILERCEQMKNNGVLAKVYTHNGFVKVARTMRDRPVKVSHISELSNFLPNVWFVISVEFSINWFQKALAERKILSITSKN